MMKYAFCFWKYKCQMAAGAWLVFSSGCTTHEQKHSVPPLWLNSQGISFSPVSMVSLEAPDEAKASHLLFSIEEVSEAQMAEFHAALGINGSSGENPSKAACNVSWTEAVAYCAWLTQKERASGFLKGEQRYRLPSDHEWSCAVGIGHLESKETAPEAKGKGNLRFYPWGQTWPPPSGVGNLAGMESRFDFPENHIAGFKDRYRHYKVGLRVSKPNRFGLYDMSGNLWEWCDDRFRPGHDWRVLRGGSWMTARPETLLSSHRTHDPENYRSNSVGFRIVLEDKRRP